MNFLKKAYRLIRYDNERVKTIREISIKNQQGKLLAKSYNPLAKKLIIFIIPGVDWATGKDKISGGTISIVSLCEETAKIKHIHDSEVIMCTWREDHLFLKHTMFKNQTNVFRYEQIATYFTELEEILIHLPEFMINHITNRLTSKDWTFFQRLEKVHINIMNQNIRLMPDVNIIQNLLQITPQVTITTAHQRYCTLAYRAYYNVPIHKFSVWVSPEQYQFNKWAAKKELIVVSPDEHPLKEKVLKKLKDSINLEVKIIKDLTYEQYKALIAEAKWSLTFGEGLDGYFVEPIFSGAISFAVYNEQFFTESFQGLRTVYSSYEELLSDIVEDIQALDHRAEFELYQKEEFDTCAQLYNYENYRKNVEAFYKYEYTFE